MKCLAVFLVLLLLLCPGRHGGEKVRLVEGGRREEPRKLRVEEGAVLVTEREEREKGEMLDTDEKSTTPVDDNNNDDDDTTS